MQKTGSGVRTTGQSKQEGAGTNRSQERTRGTVSDGEGSESQTDKSTTADIESESESEEKTIDPNVEGECPECDGRIVSDDAHAERVCSECGLVIKTDEIDHGPDWRAFNQEERDKKSRTGSPSTMLQHDKGLSTQIGWENKDGYGNRLSQKRRRQMARLRKRDEWYRVREPGERTLRQALSEIQRMGSALGMDKEVQEMASVIYRRASEEGLLLGRSIEGVATAALYAACRQAGIPRTPDEVAATSRTGKRPFERAYRCIVTELGLAVEATAAESYIPQFTSEIEFCESEEVEKLSRELLDAGRDENLHSGRSPSGLAGSAIYAAALSLEEDITQPEVAEAADTTCVTIRTHYRDLLQAADRPVPETDS